MVLAFIASWSGALLMVAAIGLGGTLLIPAATRVYLERCRYHDNLLASAHRYEEQHLAYEYMLKALANRPTDSEMARWLDFDKAHVKAQALKHYLLTNRRVIAHAILAEGTANSRTAGATQGPARYSEYLIHVFMLTEGGVRRVTSELNFRTGEVTNGERMTFHYDAVAAAEVSKTRTWIITQRRTFAGQGRQRHRFRARDSRHQSGPEVAQVMLRRYFQLSLVSGQTYQVPVAIFYEGSVDRLKQIEKALLEMALDVSGINNALWILETVAAEGKGWIDRERERRKRRFTKLNQELAD